MTYLVATILGLVQGATEFIPISSSGHLILVRELLGQNDTGGLAFDAVLQLATSLAVLVYFWKDILNLLKTLWVFVTRREVIEKDRILLTAIILGTIPAVVIGLLLESQMETIFRSSQLVALTLLLGSLLIFYAQRVASMDKFLTVGKGVTIGFFQVLALIPGVSRSGATISGGLITGLNKDDAVRFSFLLSLPILFGSGLKKLFELRGDLFGNELGAYVLVGSLTAFITGLLAINFLVKYLRNNNLNIFIWYRVALAVLIFVFL